MHFSHYAELRSRRHLVLELGCTEDTAGARLTCSHALPHFLPLSLDPTRSDAAEVEANRLPASNRARLHPIVNPAPAGSRRTSQPAAAACPGTRRPDMPLPNTTWERSRYLVQTQCLLNAVGWPQPHRTQNPISPSPTRPPRFAPAGSLAAIPAVARRCRQAASQFSGQHAHTPCMPVQWRLTLHPPSSHSAG